MIESDEIRETRLLFERMRAAQPPAPPPNTIAGGREGGDNGGMEARLKALEEALPQIRQDLAVMRSNYVTKADVAEVRGELKAEIANSKTSIIMWVVGTIILAQVLPALPGIVKGIMTVIGQ